MSPCPKSAFLPHYLLHKDRQPPAWVSKKIEVFLVCLYSLEREKVHGMELETRRPAQPAIRDRRLKKCWRHADTFSEAHVKPAHAIAEREKSSQWKLAHRKLKRNSLPAILPYSPIHVYMSIYYLYTCCLLNMQKVLSENDEWMGWRAESEKARRTLVIYFSCPPAHTCWMSAVLEEVTCSSAYACHTL